MIEFRILGVSLHWYICNCCQLYYSIVQHKMLKIQRWNSNVELTSSNFLEPGKSSFHCKIYIESMVDGCLVYVICKYFVEQRYQ
jgi:hypothetical protein